MKFNRNKSLTLFLANVLIVFFSILTNQIAVADSSFSGCPSNWPTFTKATFPFDNGLPAELVAAKKSIGYSLVITNLGEEYSTDGQTWKSITSDPYIQDSLSYALSGSSGRFGFKIDILNCPSSATIYFTYDRQKFNAAVTQSDISSFFSVSSNRDRFVRGQGWTFKDTENLPSALADCKTQILKQATTLGYNGKSQTFYSPGPWNSTGILACDFLKNASVGLFPHSLNCFDFDGQGFKIGVKQSCDATIGLHPAFSNQLISFAEVAIQGPANDPVADKQAELYRYQKIFTGLNSDLRPLMIPAKQDRNLSIEASGIARAIYDASEELNNLFNSPNYSQTNFESLANLRVNSLASRISALTSNIQQISSISCIKGKITKQFTGFHPTCPNGYKIKK